MMPFVFRAIDEHPDRRGITMKTFAAYAVAVVLVCVGAVLARRSHCWPEPIANAVYDHWPNVSRVGEPTVAE